MDLAPTARHFRSFGRDAARDSPLYGQLSELIVESPALLEPAARSAEGTPMVFLATVHDELPRSRRGARRPTRSRAAAACCPPSRRSPAGGRSR